MVNIPPNPLKRVVKSRRRRENFGDLGPDTWLFPPLVGGDFLTRGGNNLWISPDTFVRIIQVLNQHDCSDVGGFGEGSGA